MRTVPGNATGPAGSGLVSLNRRKTIALTRLHSDHAHAAQAGQVHAPVLGATSFAGLHDLVGAGAPGPDPGPSPRPRPGRGGGGKARSASSLLSMLSSSRVRPHGKGPAVGGAGAGRGRGGQQVDLATLVRPTRESVDRGR